MLFEVQGCAHECRAGARRSQGRRSQDQPSPDALFSSSACEDGDGVNRAIRLALQDSGTSLDEIGMISAHANGTRVSDAGEARAFAEIFGASPIPVASFKWSLGHTIAASGVIESILTLHCLANGRVPGIPTLEELSPDCAGVMVSRSVQKPRTSVGIVVSRAFAGLNSCIVFASNG